MNVLGLETSCDETAAAVVKDGKHVLSNVVASSLQEHAQHGGIIPEIASRRQLEFIIAVAEKALIKAKVKLKDIDAVAVTSQPGLIGSLLVGISFARGLSFAIQKPLVSVNHIEAHAYANFLEAPGAAANKKSGRQKPKLPAIALVVSGGHTNLYHVKAFDQFRLLGQTLDDAAGEAFDKVAKILDLGYPGGPAIDGLAKNGKNTNVRFKSTVLPDTYNFSFSGVKTAVLYHCRDHKLQKEFSPAKTAYSFQDSVVLALTQKSISACRKFNIETLLIGGGVAANSALRAKLNEASSQHNIHAHFPPLSLCTDNAAMIAGLGFHLINERRITCLI
ncbi:MAG: tRNA (adenosine(37)-N6)-threonylcarbamoyltransferase complex transferase subunit TsaD [Candidatus Omnitrophica bacterium]|nr:tRNA (adenosine(37)-N6)-threonylcarbamoyltransferase complex transferase subunit TsaD [Candidatus Omnitrophota bacterium]